jgi:hypothetical protein
MRRMLDWPHGAEVLRYCVTPEGVRSEGGVMNVDPAELRGLAAPMDEIGGDIGA